MQERDHGAHGPARAARSAPNEARREGRLSGRYLELVCPAGTPAALRAAVDALYCAFRDCTNARNYPGLNFDPDELREGITHAHDRGCKVLIAINTFPRAGDVGPWHRAVDEAAAAGADAVILADIGVLDYATRRHPGLRRHLSVQASAANAPSIAFYRENFDIKIGRASCRERV